MVQQREVRYLNEWLWLNHPTHLTWKRVRLGPYPVKGAGALLGVVQKWVDAVVYDGEQVWLIEAKLKRDIGVVSQLNHYRRVFRETPEFTELHAKPIRAKILMPFDDPAIRQEAQLNNIEYEVFAPEWVMKELVG